MITRALGRELVVIRLQAPQYRTHSRSIMYKIMTGAAAIATSSGTRISQLQHLLTIQKQ